MSSRKEEEGAYMFRLFNSITIIIRGSRIRFPFASRGFDHWFRMNVKGIGIEDGNNPGASAILAKAKLLFEIIDSAGT
jgi:hypothetical protein